METSQLARCSRSKAAVECHDLVDLASILEPDVHVAIWRRPVDVRIVRLLERPDCVIGRHSRLVGRAAELNPERLAAGLVPAAARGGDPSGAAALADDAHRLCEMFAELLCADELMVSLESPDGATCPRFHVDRVGIRMLVTYVGPGTQWLPDEHVDRRRLGSAGHGLPDRQNGVMRRDAEVQQVSSFDVLLLKGEAWPGAEGFGAVHRSPDPGGRRRVLLRVDMLSQCALDAEARR